MLISFENRIPKKKNFVFYYRVPGNAKSNSGLNPEADEFVPVFTVTFIIIIFHHLKVKFPHVFFCSEKVVLDLNLEEHRQAQCR